MPDYGFDFHHQMMQEDADQQSELPRWEYLRWLVQMVEKYPDTLYYLHRLTQETAYESKEDDEDANEPV